MTSCGVRQPNPRMEMSPIVAEFDPTGNIFSGFSSHRVHRAVDKLNLQRPVNGFGQRVIETLTGQYPWSYPLAG
jgi:hypothetical protein